MPLMMITTYHEDENIDVINAVQRTMLSKNQVILNLTETYKTVKNIKARKTFLLVLLIFYTFKLKANRKFSKCNCW